MGRVLQDLTLLGDMAGKVSKGLAASALSQMPSLAWGQVSASAAQAAGDRCAPCIIYWVWAVFLLKPVSYMK